LSQKAGKFIKQRDDGFAPRAPPLPRGKVLVVVFYAVATDSGGLLTVLRMDLLWLGKVHSAFQEEE
jgi:hypothetical protein